MPRMDATYTMNTVFFVTGTAIAFMIKYFTPESAEIDVSFI